MIFARQHHTHWIGPLVLATRIHPLTTHTHLRFVQWYKCSMSHIHNIILVLPVHKPYSLHLTSMKSTCQGIKLLQHSQCTDLIASSKPQKLQTQSPHQMRVRGIDLLLVLDLDGTARAGRSHGGTVSGRCHGGGVDLLLRIIRPPRNNHCRTLPRQKLWYTYTT